MLPLDGKIIDDFFLLIFIFFWIFYIWYVYFHNGAFIFKMAFFLMGGEGKIDDAIEKPERQTLQRLFMLTGCYLMGP